MSDYYWKFKSVFCDVIPKDIFLSSEIFKTMALVLE